MMSLGVSSTWSTSFLSISAESPVWYFINFFFPLWRCSPTRAMTSSTLRFLDHTQQRTTVGRTPLDEWSARRRDLYLTTHDTHNRHPCHHNLSKRAAADLRLKSRGHQDRHFINILMFISRNYSICSSNMCDVWQQYLCEQLFSLMKRKKKDVRNIRKNRHKFIINNESRMNTNVRLGINKLSKNKRCQFLENIVMRYQNRTRIHNGMYTS